jgi:pseudouridine kinase
MWTTYKLSHKRTKNMTKIVCIGGANLDIIGSSDQVFSAGDSNPGLIKYSAGGVARNIAENLQRLGEQCTLISALGNDLGKEKVLENARAVGIDIGAIEIFDSCASGTYVAINNQLGSLMAAIADMNIIEKITPDYLSKRIEIIEQADYVVIDGNLPEQTIAWIGQQTWRPKLVADAVSAAKAPKLKSILSKLSILKVNRDEAENILGTHDTDENLAKRLIELGVEKVLLSQGAHGALVATQSALLHLPAKREANNSDTGGGDALLSGFIAVQSKLDSIEYQLDFALSCASFTLSSNLSVHPELSIETIKKRYLQHIPTKAWH